MLCPVCQQAQTNLVRHFHRELDAPLQQALCAEKADWHPTQGVCSRCLDQAQLNAQGKTSTTTIDGYAVLSLPQRLPTLPGLTGRGITICFIDSDFFPHPDLAGRIVARENFADDPGPDQDLAWHGTMTSVVGAGDGASSGGYYTSLAPGVQVALLRVGSPGGRISGGAILKALEWATAHAKALGIRVINLSVTDDDDGSYQTNAVNLAVARAVSAGIVVVAAVGNQMNAPIKAPANSPHAITVGGLDDYNTLHPLQVGLYHSTYGNTRDGLHKPDLIAPAIWIPAPILPGSRAQAQAALCFALLEEEIPWTHRLAYWHNLAAQLDLPRPGPKASPLLAQRWAESIIRDQKWLSPHYQHADGTSFAAPIVSALVALALEAKPDLTPAAIRALLFSTARPLPFAPLTRQGYGVVHPLSALCAATDTLPPAYAEFTPLVDYQRRCVHFRLHHPGPKVALAGDFNQWDPVNLCQEKPSFWETSIAWTKPGAYHYKYLLNDQDWVPDPLNLLRASDGWGGFQSKIWIEATGSEPNPPNHKPISPFTKP